DRVLQFFLLADLFLFSSILLFFFTHILFTTPGSKVGFFFSSVSLFFGLIFFLYSMKYYVTIACILLFSGKKLQKNSPSAQIGLVSNLEDNVIRNTPFISIHLATYNEKRVIDRLLTGCANQEYQNYEVVIVDDSTDETIELLEKWKTNPKIKIFHRETREGFKGGALQKALEIMDPRTEFVIVLDADFIPYPDTITQFLKYFQAATGEDYRGSNIAAIQGYQWHVLNKSENWITRGVRSEYAGSYVVERSGTEFLGSLKQIAGSVYMIRADVLKYFGWGTSITEDFQLTLRLYEKGYKVIYTPYIQAPAECVSTIRRLIRQRMRWAEGHTHNIRRMSAHLLRSPFLSLSEKLEFAYLSPYYLQAAFFIIGTLSWFVSEAVFHTRLPYWTSLWGWSLVFSNMLALPLMNSVGLFLEEAEEKDYVGFFSFVVLSYIVAPFQAYAAIKGLIEKQEGPWFRTPKSGLVTDVIQKGKIFRFFSGLFPSRVQVQQISSPQPGINLSVAFQSAHNSFSSFQIRKRLSRIGDLTLVLLLLSSLVLFMLSPLIQTGMGLSSKSFGVLASTNEEEAIPSWYPNELSWGVIAMNTTKESYLPGEDVEIDIGVLNNKGEMVCDADIKLRITNPGGEETDLTTRDGGIRVSETCLLYGRIEKPDFQAIYRAEEPGEYTVMLEVEIPAGKRQTTREFRVVSEKPYEVVRHASTRIYPKVSQTVEIDLIPNDSYQGEIIEQLSPEFVVEESKEFTVTKDEYVQKIVWEKELKIGEKTTLR
ncbi:MAG TPA: glycosyltransferase family 2 protein, partial [Patescibacteria group bacterium]|nr:glycosyltransferase family 2 protein [Patescibacteria group bacterium]